MPEHRRMLECGTATIMLMGRCARGPAGFARWTPQSAGCWMLRTRERGPLGGTDAPQICVLTSVNRDDLETRAGHYAAAIRAISSAIPAPRWRL